jgi:competence protein ComEA
MIHRLAFVLLVLPAWAQELPPGPGRDTFADVCSQCHTLSRPMDLRKTRAEWQATIDRMAAKGAPASAEQFEAIVNYLTKNFGKEEVPVELPEGPGKQIILRECIGCHMPEHFTKYRRTNEEWQAIVIRMGQRVRSATTEELDTVQKYLAANYPKIEDTTKLNVNKATANEIETQLNFTGKEAEAIVHYREEHGDFREWGEMLVIYGVDGRKIAAVKDKMGF